MADYWRSYRFWLYLLALCVLVRGAFFYANLQSPLQVEGTLIHEVRSGQSLSGVLDELGGRDVLRKPFDLKVYARLSGRAGRLQAGEYALNDDMNALDLLDKMVRGDVHHRQVVLVEGWTAARALAALHASDHVRNTLDAGDMPGLQAALDMDHHPEGWLYPDTYHFRKGVTDVELLRRAHDRMREVLAEEWEGRDVGLPYEEPYEALIMASIVEKETAVADERRRIAGVFVRRLQSGMRLQTDPSVIYGLGDAFTGNLTRAHLQTDNPYNTYRRAGLPPTPIALPGRAAIAASLRPAEEEALYFVARGDGTHYFSATLEEHNAAVRQYQIERRPEDKEGEDEDAP